jgi:Uma2 family endonuclease
MAADSTAPWAEPVMQTAEDLAALPDDAWRHELLRGRLVRMSPTGLQHGVIAMRVARALSEFVEEHDLGRVAGAETGFLISRPGRPSPGICRTTWRWPLRDSWQRWIGRAMFLAASSARTRISTIGYSPRSR